MTSCKMIGTVIIGIGLVLPSRTLAVELDPLILDGLSREDVKERIRKHVETMDVPALIGQKLLVGLPWTSPETNDSQFLSPLLSKYKIGNFFVSDRVYRDWRSFVGNEPLNERPAKEEIKQHITRIRDQMREAEINIPPIVATDYEGGRVQHLRHKGFRTDGTPMPPWETPSPMAFAAAARKYPSDISTFGSLVGQHLRQLGFTTNFAPLADLSNETTAPIIGTRSFSSEPSVVQAMATRFSRGLVDGGVVPVLKHWPGLGGFDSTNGHLNRNLDVHDFEEPLPLKWNISRYAYLYRKLLSRSPLSLYGAVMSSHVTAREYENKCGPEDTVSTCNDIVAEKFRKGLDQEQRVLLSDDLAYLRALYRDMSDPSALAKVLDRIFQSDHDIAIVGSTVPRRRILDDCRRDSENFGCAGDFFEKALEQLYLLYEGKHASLETIKNSVARILQWKYYMYLNIARVHGKPDDLISGRQHKDFLSAFLAGDIAYELGDRESHDDILRKLGDLTERVLISAVSLVASPDYPPRGRWAKRLGLGNNSKVLCVGPTHGRNDLRAALGPPVVEMQNLDCVDLFYNAAARADDEFVESNTEIIKSFLNNAVASAQPYDVLIFGMSDIPKHQQVAKNVSEFLGEFGEMAAKVTIWVAFDSPTVLSSEFVTERDYALATFSNSAMSNQIIADVLFRPDSRKAPGLRYQLPVEVPALVDHHVEPMETCPKCERSNSDWQDYASMIFGLLGAIVAVLTLWCVRSKQGRRKEWWTISALAGCSGFVLFLAGSAVKVDPSWTQYEAWQISVDLKPGMDFVVPLVLTFVAFGLLNFLARVATSLAKRDIPTEQ